MPTANENLRNAIARHQIGLVRVANGMRTQVLNHLKRTERDLRSRLIARVQGLAGTASASGFVVDQTARKRLARLEESIKQARSVGFDELFSELREGLDELALAEPRFLRSAIAATIPLELTTTLPSRSELLKIVTSRPFQGRILRQWASTIEEDERRRIMNEIRIGLTQGETVHTIARRIVGTAELAGSDGVTEITRRHAQMIVRTSVTHITSAAATAFAQANSHLFDSEIYMAILDTRTSDICLTLNGKVYPIGRGRFPPQHPNCRSRRIPYIPNSAAVRQKLRPSDQRRFLREFAEENGLGRVRSTSELTPSQRAAFGRFVRNRIRQIVGGVPSVPSTEEFLAGLSLTEMSELLGVTKARLVRRGRLSIGRLVDRHGQPLTLQQLAAREALAFERAGLEIDQFLQ